MKGRKPIPAEMKILRGTLDRIPARRPVVAPLVPPMPRWVAVFGGGPDSKDLCRAASRLWRSLVPELDRAGIIGRLDGVLLGEICVCWSRLQLVERQLTEQGMVIEAVGRPDRGAVKNPLTTVAGQLRQSLRFYLAELGLTPAARERLTVKPDDDADSNSPFDV